MPLFASATFVGLLGLSVGSFLNVCIVRIPQGNSIVSPRSRCPKCDRQLGWYENIPLLSFVCLRGRCRGCHQTIGWRYPLVELGTALLALLLWFRLGEVLPWSLWFGAFIAPLIVITFIDLEHQIIPDVISISGIAVGLVTRAILAPPGMMGPALVDGGVGVLVGGGFLFAIAFLYEKLRGQEGLGGGDIKLAGMIGAFLGWQAILVVLMLSAMLGSIVGLIVIGIMRKGLRFAIPYGPFLAGGAIFYLFWGRELLEWYMSLIMR